MFILGNFIGAIAHVLNMVITILYWLILIRALISWVNPDPYNPIVQFLIKATEPILYPIRRRMGLYNIGFDISPIIAFLLLMFIRYFLVTSLFGLSVRLGG